MFRAGFPQSPNWTWFWFPNHYPKEKHKSPVEGDVRSPKQAVSISFGFQSHLCCFSAPYAVERMSAQSVSGTPGVEWIMVFWKAFIVFLWVKPLALKTCHQVCLALVGGRREETGASLTNGASSKRRYNDSSCCDLSFISAHNTVTQYVCSCSCLKVRTKFTPFYVSNLVQDLADSRCLIKPLPLMDSLHHSNIVHIHASFIPLNLQG